MSYARCLKDIRAWSAVMLVFVMMGGFCNCWAEWEDRGFAIAEYLFILRPAIDPRVYLVCEHDAIRGYPLELD
ncbi:hypothetical protein BDZ45DRAFT_738740 [Acephala macrosclerotiorum]|nr:hypothetical protein BDZ45DRAFT_738740 [Acephala macrosclerotiorum]